MDLVKEIINRLHIFSHDNQGILIAKVRDTHEGFTLAKEILSAVCNRQAILYLSGGRTPKELYRKLSDEEKLEVGAVGLIDERFGDKWHETSNEKMLQDSGLLSYLKAKDITFYPILSSGTREEAAKAYDEKVREFHTLYQKHVGILGIGLDGHTAGIAGSRPDFSDPLFDSDRKQLLVSEFDDQKGMYKERVTMTFLGLSMLDLNIILVFGDDKKEALEKMFSDGSEEDIPSRFFKRPDIAQKTILITDQEI